MKIDIVRDNTIIASIQRGQGKTTMSIYIQIEGVETTKPVSQLSLQAGDYVVLENGIQVPITAPITVTKTNGIIKILSQIDWNVVEELQAIVTPTIIDTSANKDFNAYITPGQRYGISVADIYAGNWANGFYSPVVINNGNPSTSAPSNNFTPNIYGAVLSDITYFDTIEIAGEIMQILDFGHDRKIVRRITDKGVPTFAYNWQQIGTGYFWLNTEDDTLPFFNPADFPSLNPISLPGVTWPPFYRFLMIGFKGRWSNFTKPVISTLPASPPDNSYNLSYPIDLSSYNCNGFFPIALKTGVIYELTIDNGNTNAIGSTSTLISTNPLTFESTSFLAQGGNYRFRFRAVGDISNVIYIKNIIISSGNATYLSLFPNNWYIEPVTLSDVAANATTNAQNTLPAGTISQAPLVFTPGVAQQNPPIPGALNYDGTNFYVTDAAGVNHQVT
jgi:hypothetical protein